MKETASDGHQAADYLKPKCSTLGCFTPGKVWNMVISGTRKAKHCPTVLCVEEEDHTYKGKHIGSPKPETSLLLSPVTKCLSPVLSGPWVACEDPCCLSSSQPLPGVLEDFMPVKWNERVIIFFPSILQEASICIRTVLLPLTGIVKPGKLCFTSAHITGLCPHLLLSLSASPFQSASLPPPPLFFKLA